MRSVISERTFTQENMRVRIDEGRPSRRFKGFDRSHCSRLCVERARTWEGLNDRPSERQL